MVCDLDAKVVDAKKAKVQVPNLERLSYDHATCKCFFELEEH